MMTVLCMHLPDGQSSSASDSVGSVLPAVLVMVAMLGLDSESASLLINFEFG